MRGACARSDDDAPARRAARAQDGRVALHFVAENGNEAIAALLIEHKADVNAKYEVRAAPRAAQACALRPLINLPVRRAGGRRHAAAPGGGVWL